MAERFEVSYEEIDDVFYIGKSGKVKFSIDVSLPSGDVIVDIGFDGLVKSLEIMNASDFFSLNKENLNAISAGRIAVVYGPSYGAITIFLRKGEKEIKSNLVIPYNKKLAVSA